MGSDDVPRDIQQATDGYEAWLRRWVPLDDEDLDRKHAEMLTGAFAFLRATFYRWAECWPIVCPDLVTAPKVLAVGDVHVENFGTWRDVEGRLVWGVNDVDEAAALPYTSDLVRLATSAELADGVEVKLPGICKAVLAGYAETLHDADPQPFVLAERHGTLRKLATDRLKNPEKFWAKKLEPDGDEGPELVPVDRVPDDADQLLSAALPGGGLDYQRYRRRSGLGSLGRPRFAALATWRGGQVARDVKALAPSGWLWAHSTPEEAALAPIRSLELLTHPGRCPDPTVTVQGRWIVRRLAPDCSRIELGDLAEDDQDDEATRSQQAQLLSWMGQELAGLHRANPYALATVRTHLASLTERAEGWLRDATEAMAQATRADFKAYGSASRTPEIHR
jgi:Uncharacterized protein conserved in bacteria (DUF2252)